MLRRFHLFPLCLVVACDPHVPDVKPSTSAIVGLFDPLAMPMVAPQPNDLLSENGHPLIVDEEEATPAQIELNAYLRGLEGFAPELPARADFSGPLDVASLRVDSDEAPGSLLILDETEEVLLAAASYQASLAQEGRQIVLRPASGSWSPGHRYLVVIFGGDAEGALRGEQGERVVASMATFFARGTRPLLARCADLERAECACPFDETTGYFAAGCHPSSAGLSLERAELFELERLRLSAALQQALAVASSAKRRDDVVLAWEFTTSAGPFVRFDPDGLQAPFPNDLFFDARQGLVQLPVDQDLSQGEREIRCALNELDGFSTSGEITVPLATADDAQEPPLGVEAGETLRLVDMQAWASELAYEAGASMVDERWAGQLLIAPTQPLLPDGHPYLALITSAVSDSRGRRLEPSLMARLMRMQAPLWDGESGRSNIDLFDDETAARWEALRLRQADLWETAVAATGIPRDELAFVWAFHTQSIVAPLIELAALPAARSLPTDVVLTAQTPGGALPDVSFVVHGRMHSHLALGDDGTLDLAGGSEVELPFIMTLPPSPPSGEASVPVALIQHDFGRWRGDMRWLANRLAAAGWASIAIDMALHGARAGCRADSDCADGGSCAAGVCSTALRVACDDNSQCNAGGVCDRQNGTCSNGLAPDSELCMSHGEPGVVVQECLPVASGTGFFDLAHPLATRDLIRQQVVDLAQLVRVLASDAPDGLRARLALLAWPCTVDAGHLAVVGQGVGAVEGMLAAAVLPPLAVGVFSATGGRWGDWLAGSETLSTTLNAYVMGRGMTWGSLGFQEVVNRLRWLLDPADGANLARHLVGQPLMEATSRRVIVQVAGGDGFVPPALGDDLARVIGLPMVGGHAGVEAVLAGQLEGDVVPVSTYFASQGHELLLPPGGAYVAGTQAVQWIISDGETITPSGD